MRRSSQSRLQTQMSEPLIVVEESDAPENDGNRSKHTSTEGSSSEGSPTNPYLLSPWRQDARKHSLPTPQCAGITASQVRRLSERSGESAAQSAREAAFLATLSANPVPSPGGRRHSVVTISKVPSTLFGRSRRESVSAFPNLGSRILPGRRESFAGPPSTEPRGSLHNLQLDIMDDIVRARKVRMKMWNTSNEKVCEVQPLDDAGAGGVQRYTNSSGRRYSDFVGTTLTPIPSSSKRRPSELPPSTEPQPATTNASKQSTGIVCSNTDLISILSSLTSSATEINNQCDATMSPMTTDRTESKASNLEQRRSRLKSNRSNSFDISTLHGTGNNIQPPDNKTPPTSTSTIPVPTNWFAKRHLPISIKTDFVVVAAAAAAGTSSKTAARAVTFANDKNVKGSKLNKKPAPKSPAESGKVVWDERSGSIVDPQLLGNAIEVFLRQGGPEPPRESSNSLTVAAATTTSAVVATTAATTTTTTAPSPSKGAIPKTSAKNTAAKSKSSWFSSKGDDSDYTETCDSSSLCSTLKDLFVK